jgi:hypothetical protein
VEEGSNISASTFGLGKGGLVDVQAELLTVAGSLELVKPAGIFSSANATGESGDGGGVRVRADTLRLTSGGSI